MVLPLLARRRYAARYRQITRTLVAHGFGGLIAPLELRVRDRLASMHGHSMAAAPEDELGDVPPRGARTRPVHLRLALEELGPTFIKLGQILSTRADLLPADYIAELVKLQDQVPPAPFPEIAAVIEEELGKPVDAIFAEIEPHPLAAASIGQVHAARLRDGTEVVVKVQRPGVDRVIAQDLVILADLAGLAARRVKIARQHDFPGLVAEFSWTLRTELDFVREGHNADRFAQIFAEDDRVRIPRVYWMQTTGRVLTLERLRGVRIDDLTGLAAVGHERRELAQRAAQIFLREVFEVGFFHADPHPGNFLVLADGTIGALDFGMVGTIDERLRERLLMTLIAVVERDAARIADDVVDLGAAGPDLNREALQRDISHLLAQYYGRPLQEIPVTQVIQDTMATVQRHGLRLPAELALLAKAVAMNEALGRLLDPTFDVTGVAEPYVRRALRGLYSPGFWWQKLRLRPLEVMLLSAALPAHVQRLFTRLERNDLTFRIRYDELPQALAGLNGMVNRLALAILTAGGGVGLAILYQSTQPPVVSWLGLFFVAGFTTTTLVGVLLIVVIWRSGR